MFRGSVGWPRPERVDVDAVVAVRCACYRPSISCSGLGIVQQLQVDVAKLLSMPPSPPDGQLLQIRCIPYFGDHPHLESQEARQYKRTRKLKLCKDLHGH
jgi:hypothetical protein